MLRKWFRRAGSFALALMVMGTSFDASALASEPLMTGEEVMEEAEEEHLKEKLRDDIRDDAKYPGGVFGFYETILNAKEGDGLKISVVRQGSTDKEASVVFKAVDVSTEYNKDYSLSIEGGAFGDKELKSAGIRPLLEEYGEAAAKEDMAAYMETTVEAAGVSENRAKEGSAVSDNEAAVAGSVSHDSAQDRAETSDPVAFGGGSSLANIYSLQTGEEAPEYDWKEYTGDEAPEETAQAMMEGWDESREKLQALPGITARLTFAPGEYKKDIKVKVKKDGKSESDEVMLFVLQEAEGAEIGDHYNGYLNISDEDAPEELIWSVKEKEITVAPGEDKAVITVVRKSGLGQMGFVTVGTQGIDAVAGRDYETTYKELFFAADVSERTVEIPVISDRALTTHFWAGIKSRTGNVSEDNACLVTIAEDPDYDPALTNAAAGADVHTDPDEGMEMDAVSDEAAAADSDGYIWVTRYNSDAPGAETYKWYGNDNDWHKIPYPLDLRDADKVRISYWTGGSTDWGLFNICDRSVDFDLCDNGNKTFDSKHYFTKGEGTEHRTDEYTRGEDDHWNYSAARFWVKTKSESYRNYNNNVRVQIHKIEIGYKPYEFQLDPQFKGMDKYQEKRWTGENKYTSMNYIDYPEVKLSNDQEKQTVYGGTSLTIKKVTGEGGSNSLGVVAKDGENVQLKGVKLIKKDASGDLSELLPENFKLTNDFKVKYKDYIYDNGRIQMVPVWEPLKIEVNLCNDNATASGEKDARGVFEGFRSDYKFTATRLDTIDVKAKAKAGNAVAYMALQWPWAASYGNGTTKRTNWNDKDNNRDKAKKDELITDLDYGTGTIWNDDRTGRINYGLRVMNYYDDASITIAPNPQSKNTSHGDILYVEGKVSGDDKSQGKVIKGGETLKLPVDDKDKIVINKTYTFGSIPEKGYHTYWKDGTLDANGDGQSDSTIPGYTSFWPAFGQSIRYVTKLPVSKIYYNFVKGVSEITHEVKPLPIRGWLKLRDRLLISGSVTERGLNGISVFCDEVETTTERASFDGKTDDGFYELKSDSFFDMLTYAVTFTGTTPYGDVAAMVTQTPAIIGTQYINTWDDVDINDVKLFMEQKNEKTGKMEYVPMDTGATKSGYYTGLTDGDYNYRIQMHAARAGMKLDKGVLTFFNPDGGRVNIETVEGASHSGIYTFDFNPKNLDIKAGATARVHFLAGTTAFMSQDVGVKVRASLGMINVYNFLLGGGSDARIDIIGAVNSAIDMGWKGNFDAATVTSDVYTDDQGNQVIKVGITKNVIDKKPEDPLTKASVSAARAAQAVGEANGNVAKLENKISKASGKEKKELEDKLAVEKDKLNAAKVDARKSKEALDGELKGAMEPRKNKPEFGNSFSMDLGFSFLMTFGYHESANKWYFKNIMLTASISAGYEVTMSYATPIGITLGIGLKLELSGSASFVVQQRTGHENDPRYFYYVDGSNKDQFNILDSKSSDPDRKLDNYGLFSIEPKITLTLSAGVAGDLLKAEVSGTAAFNMVFGTVSDSAGSCTLSASIKIKAIVFTFTKELANKTFPLWGDQDSLEDSGLNALATGAVMSALSEGADSYLYDSIDGFRAADVSYMSGGTRWYGGSGEGKAAVSPDIVSDTLLGAIDEDGEKAYMEDLLADRIGADADFDIAPLGGGRFAAVFLNVPQNRVKDPENADAAYYTLYDGNSWSLPEILEDDGTLDQYPHIYPLGDKGAFIVWSTVNEKYKDTEDKLARQNSLDLHGRFVNTDGSLREGIEEITKTTVDANGGKTGLDFSDFASDKAFGAFTDGKKMVVCFEKRQYADGGGSAHSISENSEGSDDAKIGDMIYPVSTLMGARSYDIASGKWEEGAETLDSMPALKALGRAAGEERLEAYNASVYGQTFHDYLPGVLLHEDIEEPSGYYREGGSKITAVANPDKKKGFLLDSDAAAVTIGGKDYGVIAYTLDADGNMDINKDPKALGDEELYLVTYDMASGDFGEPVILTGQEINSETGEALLPVNANPKFAKAGGSLYLSWLKGADIVALNVSYLLGNGDQLIKTGDLDGVSYRYVDKSAPSAGRTAYQPPIYLVTGRMGARAEGSEGILRGDISSFDIKSDGSYIYIIWPESDKKDMDDDKDTVTLENDILRDDEKKPETDSTGLADTQMWCVRTEAKSEDGIEALGDTTMPVQITSHKDNHYDDVAFGVIDGKIRGLARKVPSRLITAKEAKEIHGDTYDEATFEPYPVWDDAKAYPVSFWVQPMSAARIKKAGFLNVRAGEDAAFSFDILNDGFDTLKEARVTAKDKDGNSLLLYAAENAETDGSGKQGAEELTVPELIGGDRATFTGRLKLPDDAKSAEVIITLKTKDGKTSDETIKKELLPDITLRDMEVKPSGERNVYHVRGTVENIGDTRSDAGELTLASRKDEQDRRISALDYPSLAPGETFDIDTDIKVSDEDFTVSIQDVDMDTGEILQPGETAADTGALVTEELKLYARYYDGDRLCEVPVYEPVYSGSGEDVTDQFSRRVAYPEEIRKIEDVTGISVNAVKAEEDEKGSITGGRIVSTGSGIITLEEGERVDIQAAIESKSERKGAQTVVDDDGNVIGASTGAEGLTYDYEYIGDNAEFDGNGLLNVKKTGSGKLRVYVYPEDRNYSVENNVAAEVEGGGSLTLMDKGGPEPTFHDYPAAAVKTFVLDVDVVAKGERPADPARAYFTDKGIRYRISGGLEAAVSGADADITKVTIPATVKHDGKTYKITRIDANAFKGNTKITSLNIGRNVSSIRDEAFRECTALKKVTFGSGVTVIGEGAFEGCIALGNFTLPSKLDRIEQQAFMNCESIRSVTLPASLTWLGEKAFYGCGSLKSITIKSEKLAPGNLGRDAFTGISQEAEYRLAMKDQAVKDSLSKALTEETETFYDKKGIVYRVKSVNNKTLTVAGLTAAAQGKLKSLSIPKTVTYKGSKYSVTGIEDRAFAGNNKLTSVTFPKTMETIGAEAFAEALKLKSVSIPANIRTLGEGAYSGCAALKKVTISSPGLDIGEDAFSGVPDTAVFRYSVKGDAARRLKEQLIKEGDVFTDKNGVKYEVYVLEAEEVKVIGTANEGLKKLTVPDTVAYRGVKFRPGIVDAAAFKGNTKLTAAKYGKYTVQIGAEAFAGCTALQSISMKKVALIDDEAFSGCGALKSLKLPGTTEVVGQKAFAECSLIKSVTIPAAVRTVDLSAFEKCAALKTVTVKSKALTFIGAGAFNEINAEAVFKIPLKDRHEQYERMLVEAGVDRARIK